MTAVLWQPEKEFMRYFTFVGTVLFGVTASAQAGVIVSDGFEYGTQAAFETAWPPTVAGASAILDSSRFSTGAKSVTIPAAVTNRNGLTIAATGLPSNDNNVTFSFDFYDSNGAAAPYRQASIMQVGASPTGIGQLVAIGLNNNLTAAQDGGNFYMARILGFNGGAFFKLNDAGSVLRSTGWHNLKVVIDDLNYKFYVDNSLAETVSQTGLTLRSYDTLRLGTGLTSLNEAGYDNFFVGTAPAPEPATVGLLAVGTMGLLTRRRRHP